LNDITFSIADDWDTPGGGDELLPPKEESKKRKGSVKSDGEALNLRRITSKDSDRVQTNHSSGQNKPQTKKKDPKSKFY